jgi:hypothetical protein
LITAWLNTSKNTGEQVGNEALRKLNDLAANKQFISSVIDDLTNEEYHASLFIGSSQAKIAETSLGHFKCHVIDKNSTFETTRSMQYGTAAHAAIICHDLSQIEFSEFGDRRSAKWKEAEQAALLENKMLLTHDESIRLRGQYHAFWNNDVVAETMSFTSYQEESFFCQDEKTGLYLKARPDARGSAMIVDYKTTATGADKTSFSKKIADLDYDLSAAWYLKVVDGVTATRPGFRWIAQETEAPFACQVYVPSTECLRRASLRVDLILEKIARAYELNSWPTYSTTVQEIDVPTWKISEMAFV